MNRLLLAAAALLCAAAAHANPHGLLYARGQGRLHAASGGNLLYYGGPVIEHAKVYAVFWGDTVDSETKDKIGPFFSNILDSAYMDWLSEYDTSLPAVDGRAGTKQHIGRGSYAGAITIKPLNQGADLTDAMLQQELDAQIAAGKLPPSDANTLYMLYFPAGISISIEAQKSCETFCAYHEGFTSQRSGAPVYYGVMPVCGGWGCGFGGKFDALTAVSAHECIEAVTDPFPTPGDKPAYPQAWNTSGGEEIADLCTSSSKVTGHGLTSTVSQLWDNKTGACNPGPWGENGVAAAPLASVPASAKGLGWRPTWSAAAAALSR